MPLALTLRRRKEFSPFMRQLCKLLTMPAGDTVWLCSGSFRSSVLEERQLDSALRSTNAPKEIVLVGGMFWGDNRDENRQNFERIRAKLNAEVKIHTNAYIAKGNSWHAKIAMRLRDEIPIAAIIGSSNLTLQALQDEAKYWNFESDISIWLDEFDAHFRSHEPGMEEEDIAFLQFDASERLQEKERLDLLYQELNDLLKSCVLQTAEPTIIDWDKLGL